MAEDKETSTRAEQIRKERAARLEKLIRTLEAGQDKDADQFKKVDKLDKQRVKLAQKEEKFEDLGKKLFKTTMGGMFGGMGKSIPEPVKILGRMVGVMFGARARIKKKKAKLLKKVYKRAAEVGMDTSGYAEKSPEALKEIDESLDTIESIKLPKEPDPKSKRFDPIGWLLGKGPSGEVPGKAPDEPAELGKGAFASDLGGLSEAANKAIIDLSAEGLKVGSIFVHDEKMLEFYQDRMDTPARKKELEEEAKSKDDRLEENWTKLFRILGRAAKEGGGSGEGKGGFLAGFMKSILNPKTAMSMLIGAGIIGNPASIVLFLGAGTAIGGFLGALLVALGVGVLALGATLIVLGKGLTALGVGMKDIPAALKEFETIDGVKLQQAIDGMDGLFLSLVGFGLGGWVSKAADLEFMKGIPSVLKEFETVDGDALSKVGKGMTALGLGLGAQGLGAAAASIGNLIAGGFNKLSEFLGVDGPLELLEEFSLADIDEDKVVANANAMGAWAKAMALAGAGTGIAGIGTFLGAVSDGLLALFGVKDADPISQLKKFGAEDLDPLGLVKKNAEAMAAFGKAMENAPVIKGSVVGGLFGAIVEAFGGKVVYPWDQVEIFAAAKLDTAKIRLNAEALVAFADAMSILPDQIETTRVGGLYEAIKKLFAGDIVLPWKQVETFAALTFNTEKIKLNAEALVAFSTAMQSLPPKVEGDRVGGLWGGIADFFAGKVKMPWEDIKKFGEADLGVVADVIANTEALIAFGKAIESMPAKVAGTREGGVFGAIADIFAGTVKMPWEQIEAFSLVTFDTAKIKLNTEALVAFAIAMESMPAKVEGIREGGVIGAIASFFAGPAKMPWDQVREFAEANLGDLNKIIANTEKLVAFSKAMEYMPPPMDTGPTLSLPDFGAILANIKARFTGGVADILSNIPTWALPAAAEEWLAANQSPEQALQAAEGRKESAQQRLAEIESKKAEIQDRGGTIRAQQETALSQWGTGNYAGLDAGQTEAATELMSLRRRLDTEIAGRNRTDKIDKLNQKIVEQKSKLDVFSAQVATQLTADEIAKIATLDADAATARQRIVTAEEEISEILKSVKLGTQSSLGVTLVDLSGTPLDTTKWALTSQGFMAKDYVENIVGASALAAARTISILGVGSGSYSMTGGADLGDTISGAAAMSITGGGSGAGIGMQPGGEVPAEAPDTGMQGAGGTQQLRGGVTVQNMSAEAWKTTTTSRGASSHKNYGVEGKKAWGYRSGKLGATKAFVVHHTAGRGTAKSVMNVFRKRNVSSNFIIDREGVIWRSVPPGYRSQHMRKGQGKGKGLSNANTQSVEIIAKDDADVTPTQVGAAMSLISSLGYKANQVLGHGEVNPHKRKTEGNRVVSAIRGEPRLLHRDERRQLGSGELEAVQLGSVSGFAAQREELFGGGSVSVEAPDSPDTTHMVDSTRPSVGGPASVPSPHAFVGKNVQGQNLTPAAGAGGGGGVMIVNSGNSSSSAVSTNNQLNQEPGWTVFHTPVYRRGGYV